MEINDYYNVLEEIADKCLNEKISIQDCLQFWIENENSLLQEIIEFRKQFVTSKELDEIRGYLEIGFFNEFKGVERVTCFVICFEAEEIATKKSWRQRCEVYNASHPLFQKAPHLLEHVLNGDLIDTTVIQQRNDCEILEFEGGFTYLDSTINPLIVSWAFDNFKNKKIYIRAHPYKVFTKEPMQFVFESILMPANPNWWKKLTVHNRMKEGASYLLDECTPKEDLRQYWEYRVKNIRRLEVIAKRNNSGNLSMMIEELTDIDRNGLMFGRCIHLDTDAKYGTPFEESILNHIDLAINIYEGSEAVKRKNDNLAFGNVTTDASYRTHLIRVEEIPFKSVFGFVISFFKSQTLINEWFQDQFRDLTNQEV